MKSVIKVINMKSQKDASSIQSAVINNEGIIAIQTSLKKNEITVIYNDIYINIDKIIGIIEDLGYVIIWFWFLNIIQKFKDMYYKML